MMEVVIACVVETGMPKWAAVISTDAPVASAANFFAVKTAIVPKVLFTQLHARGILIRDVSSAPLLKDYVRISVGTPDENTQLLSALRNIFEQENA